MASKDDTGDDKVCFVTRWRKRPIDGFNQASVKGYSLSNRDFEKQWCPRVDAVRTNILLQEDMLCMFVFLLSHTCFKMSMSSHPWVYSI